MGYHEEMQDIATSRLKELLALPLPKSKDDLGVLGFFDPWDAFDGIVGAYASEIDEMAIKTLVAVQDRTTFDLLKSDHSLFVQFFLHVLAGHGYVDYGTSPRGAFPSAGVESLLDEWIAKWEAWAAIQWDQDAD